MPLWRRNLLVLFGVQLLSTIGFSLVFPFVPLYVKEIGIATRGSVEFWSALTFSSQALTMMIAAPIWGAYADRYGRKMMLVRATFGGALLLALMGMVQNAEQLVVVRALQGLVTGVVPATNALVAASAPRERSGEALGTLQMSFAIGIAIGPVLGGLLGEAFGFREGFWITAGLLALAGLAALLWVHEEFKPVPREARAGLFDAYRRLLRAPGMGGIYELSFLRSLGQTMLMPMVALFVVELQGREEGAALITGLLIGASSATAAMSGVWFGRLGDRIGHVRVLVGAAVAAMAISATQATVTSAWQLGVLQALLGFAIGGMVPSVAALMNLWSPAGNQGATYGLDTSVNSAARSLAPMVGAAVATFFGLRGVFGASAVIYGCVALLTLHVARQASARRSQQQPTLKPVGD